MKKIAGFRLNPEGRISAMMIAAGHQGYLRCVLVFSSVLQTNCCENGIFHFPGCPSSHSPHSPHSSLPQEVRLRLFEVSDKEVSLCSPGVTKLPIPDTLVLDFWMPCQYQLRSSEAESVCMCVCGAEVAFPVKKRLAGGVLH